MDAPFLFPINPEEFFSRIQKLIDDTISKRLSEQSLNLKQAPDGLLSNPDQAEYLGDIEIFNFIYVFKRL